jgi:hypothetical protein
MVIGLTINWGILDGVHKIQDAIDPKNIDINIIPDWVKDAFNNFKTNYNKNYDAI